MTSTTPIPSSESKIVKKPIITVLDQYASRTETKQIASTNGGRLPSLKEFILAIKDKSHNKQLKEAWFWTSDDGVMVSRESKIDYKEGKVIEVTPAEWKKLPFEQKAYASSGTGPVAIYFYHNSTEDHSSTLTIDSNRGALVARVAYIGNLQV